MLIVALTADQAAAVAEDLRHVQFSALISTGTDHNDVPWLKIKLDGGIWSPPIYGQAAR